MESRQIIAVTPSEQYINYRISISKYYKQYFDNLDTLNLQCHTISYKNNVTTERALPYFFFLKLYAHLKAESLRIFVVFSTVSLGLSTSRETVYEFQPRWLFPTAANVCENSLVQSNV